MPKPGAPACAVRYSIDAVTAPDLVDALTAWHRMAGPDGLFRYNVDGSFADVAGDAQLLKPRSTIALIDAAEPKDWSLLYCGAGFSFVSEHCLVGRRIGDLPSPGMLQATVESYRQLLPEARPAVHRLSGSMQGRDICYDRLWLPIADPAGEVRAFVTVAEMLPVPSESG